MLKYDRDAIPGDLESWPFDNPDSNYRILRGEPRASGRIDYLGERNRLGIWACTAGAFECTELGDELQTILRGRLILTRADGERVECGPGDSLFTRKGERVTWDIREDVVKVFFTALS